ncbi:MAG: CHAT domain-containing protein [Xenococcaceae cyanobacterium]
MKLLINCIRLPLAALRKVKRVIVPFLLAAFFVFSLGNLTTTSQTIPRDSLNSPTRAGSVTSENLAEVVERIEKKWEDQYEEYFGEDFVNLSLTASQISQKLSQLNIQTGKKPAVLWAIPQPEQLKLVLITPGNQPISKNIQAANRESLLKVVQEFHQEISNPFKIHTRPTSYLPAAQQLYQWMIAPIQSNLEAQEIDTLLFCLGAGLRSLPFAALHDGQSFLVEKYSLTRIPAFNLTQTSYSNIRNAKVLAMGASEFTNQPNLPGVEVELSTITPQLWQGVAMLNEDFTVANLQSQHQEQLFEIIHLATHAEFKPGKPSNSYIQFSDTQLGLDQIRQLNWNSPPVELLVLSACKTALGDGEAELGFAGLALQSGVKSALASLWGVSDIGTMALMNEFYQQLKISPIKAEALRQAQIAMIQGQVYLEQGELQSSRGSVSLPPELTELNLEGQNLSHPYYWAAFSMIGSPW